MTTRKCPQILAAFCLFVPVAGDVSVADDKVDSIALNSRQAASHLSDQQARFHNVTSSWEMTREEVAIESAGGSSMPTRVTSNWTWDRCEDAERIGVKFQLPARSRSPQQVDLDSYFSGGRLTLHYPLTKQVVILEEVAVRTYWPAPTDFLLPHRAPIDALLSKGAQIAVVRQGEMTLATLTLGDDGGGRIFEMTLDPSRDYRVVAWSEPATRTSCNVDWRLDRSTGDFVPVGALLTINTEGPTTTYTLTMNTFSFDTADPTVAEFRFQPGMLVGDYWTPKTSAEPQASPSVFRIGDDGKPQKVLMIDDEPVQLSSATRISVWGGALLASGLLLALRLRISK